IALFIRVTPAVAQGTLTWTYNGGAVVKGCALNRSKITTEVQNLTPGDTYVWEIVVQSASTGHAYMTRHFTSTPTATSGSVRIILSDANDYNVPAAAIASYPMTGTVLIQLYVSDQTVPACWTSGLQYDCSTGKVTTTSSAAC